MNNPLNSAFMDDSEFQSLMIECMESLQRGESVDRDALREKFPKYADDLDQYLDVLNVLDQFAGGLARNNPTSDPYEATVTPHTANCDLELGDTIRYIGEYEVLEEIARGGMGVVFKARQQTLKRTVALKMILSGRLADTAEVDRFRREAQAASRLQHPNIVAVHEIGEHEGRQYFTMDYVKGRSLAEEIREESLAPRRAAGLVKTVAEAVHFAHQRGTLHRDLKPANVLLSSDDIPHVTDFGLAKILDEVDDQSRAELTASGQILGTPSYMSPEQAAGKQNLVGPASDIYSLGAILYACLTGRAPFVADSPVDTLMQVIHQEPVSPRQLNPAVPQDLETICLKCLNKEPHKRYGTAQELAYDLQRFLEGRPVMARPIGRGARTIRWAKRNPLVASLLCLVTISLVAGTAISSYFAVETSEALRDLQIEEAKTQLANHELARERNEAISLRKEAVTARGVAESQLNKTERALYALQLSRSNEQWRLQPKESLEGLLDEKRCPAHLQDFCWRFLENLSDRFVRSYPGLYRVDCIEVTGDGKLFACCFHDQEILVISRTTGESWSLEEKPSRWVRKIAFLPDNRTLVSGCYDGTVTTWDALTGKKLLVMEHGERVKCVAVSPDGRWIVSGGDDSTQLWDTEDWKLEKTFAYKSEELVFTPDSQTLIAGSEHRIVFENLVTGETEIWEGQHERIRGLDVSPDGKLLLSSDLRVVLLRELATGNIRHRFTEPVKEKTEFSDVRFSPDGTTFVTTAGVYPPKLWDVESGESIASISPYYGSTQAIAFLPDGHQILTPAEHHLANLKLWNVPQKDPAQTVQHFAFFMSASPSNDLLATTGQGRIAIWNIRTGEIIRSWNPSETDHLEGAISKLQMLAGGKQLLSMHLVDEKCVCALWDVRTGELIRRLEGFAWEAGIAVDPVNKCLAVPGAGNTVSLRDFVSGEEIRVLGQFKQDLQCIAFSPDGNWLAYGDGSDPLPNRTPRGRLRLCNLITGEVFSLQGHDNYGIYEVAFSPDGKTLVSVGGGGILWDVQTQKLIARMEGHQSAILSVCYSPDGKTIATGSMDNTVRLWDPVTGELRITLEGHSYWVTAVKFNHDGTRLVSCSANAKVKFWDADRRHISSKIIQFNPLVGEWVVEELYRNGDKKTNETHDLGLARFFDGKVTAYGLGPVPISYDVNTQVVPNVIDLKVNRRDEPFRIRGIFKVTDDRLEIVLPDPGLPRPTAFTKEPPEIYQDKCEYWLYYKLKRKPVFERTTTELTQPLEEPPQENSKKPDATKIQMKPATVLQVPNNSGNPLVTLPDDFKVDPRKIQQWTKQLDSNSQSQRLRAFRSLARAGPEALPAFFRLLKFLEGKDSQEMLEAIGCFGAMGAKGIEAVPKLHELLKDAERSHIIRFEAANALSRMGKEGEVSIPTLITILKDPGPSNKNYLKQGTAPEAQGSMAPLVRKDEQGEYIDERDRILMQALGTLGAFGLRAAPAVPAIEHVREDPATLPAVKKQASETLHKIDGQNTRDKENEASP